MDSFGRLFHEKIVVLKGITPIYWAFGFKYVVNVPVSSAKSQFSTGFQRFVKKQHFSQKQEQSEKADNSFSAADVKFLKTARKVL
nr:hypothetical protein [uncultured Dysosmobacter sp.]